MKRWSVVLVFVCVGGALACGPTFPPSYLQGDGSAYKPNANLEYELDLVMKALIPESERSFPTVGKNRCEAEVDDFRQAAVAYVLDEQTVAQLTAAYAIWQERARSHEYRVESLDDIPAECVEFTLYVEGVRQMHRRGDGDDVRLPPAWEDLLSLPADRRRYRTTWVHYTVGNMYLARGEPTMAERHYRLVQQAAREGFVDSLGLAGACFEKLFACATSRVERLKRALPATVYGSEMALYYLRHHSNYATFSAEERRRVQEDELAREIIAACIMSSSRGANLFLDELAGGSIRHGERLAYIAYRAGDMEKTERFLAVTPDASMLKWWLQAKLYRWRGDNEGAAKALRRWLALYENARQASPDRLVFRSEGCADRTLTEEVKGLLGTLLVDQNDFVEALYTFLAAGSWWDAAFVAERLLDLDALKRYVDATCPSPTANEDDVLDNRDPVAYSKDPRLLRVELRHLLGRRLARNGRLAEAAHYLPPAAAQNLLVYAQLLARARNPEAPANDRATALYNAAKQLRHQGMDMVGSELYPDARIWYGGQFPAVETPRSLAKTGGKSLLWQAERTLPTPTRRFHYRYRAADLMREASALAADNDFRVAACYVGGMWLEARSPEAADPLYKELARIRNHPLGRRADESRWFPREVSSALTAEVGNCELRSYADIIALGRRAIPEPATD